ALPEVPEPEYRRIELADRGRSARRSSPHAGRRHTDQQIVQFMVERYGDFVLYQPPFDVRTILLWLGPAGLLMGGAVMLGSRVARARRARSAALPLTETECQRLAQLLRSTDTRRK